MNQTAEGSGASFMEKVSAFIVDKRSLIFLITIILLIFSAFSRNWVEVESDLTYYLPEDSETKQALNVMDEQFITYGTAKIMVANITLDEAAALNDTIKSIRGVQMVDYDETEDHYKNLSALYSVTFDYSEDDDACLTSLDAVKEALASYDVYVSTDLGNTQEETIDHEINIIMIYVAVVIVVVLLLTSETYGEVPVLILTFVVALVINQGTNYLLGKISFVSNSVTSILQLALSIDYAIIFCNHFKEEHRLFPIREAVIAALSKSIPEIGASCLTTVGGMVAMLFMQFKLGPDMAICLIKSIAFALLSAFLVMPGLLMLFGHHSHRHQDSCESQARRFHFGGLTGAFLLGAIFALSFCPTSAAIYFGILIPLSAKAAWGYVLPVVFAIATSIPVIIVAWLVAYSMNNLGRFVGRLQAFQRWFNLFVAVLFILIGIYHLFE